MTIKRGSKVGIAKGKHKLVLFRPELAGEAKSTVLDIFDTTGASKAATLGGKERIAHDCEILMADWSIHGGSQTVTGWLTSKGYSVSQIQNIKAVLPFEGWETHRAKILDKMTETVVKRHIDMIAEVQDLHIKASKLTLVKAMEMLSRGIEFTPRVKQKDGTTKLLPSVMLPLRSVDLTNCANAIQTAQQIYRRSMGLPNEEGGLAQILEKVGQINVQNNITNTENHLHVHAPNQNQEVLSKLTYDEVHEFIQHRREQKKLRAQAEEALKEEKKP